MLVLVRVGWPVCYFFKKPLRQLARTETEDGNGSSSSLDSMGSMITIGEGFSWGKMDGMITTVDRMINCELTT